MLTDAAQGNQPVVDSEPVQSDSETSVYFERRHAQWERATLKALSDHRGDWRFFQLAPRAGKRSKLAELLLRSGFSGTEWQCLVTDVTQVRPYRFEIHDLIKCAIDSSGRHVYSVWKTGHAYKPPELKRGDLIQFGDKLDWGSAVMYKDEPGIFALTTSRNISNIDHTVHFHVVR